MTPITYVLAFLIFIAVLTYTPSNDFSSGAWVADPNKRIELLDDLIDSGKLDNLSKEQVIAMLGQPEQGCKYFTNTKRDMIYFLGPERGLFSIDSEWLLIWFDNGKVNKYELAID